MLALIITIIITIIIISCLVLFIKSIAAFSVFIRCVGETQSLFNVTAVGMCCDVKQNVETAGGGGRAAGRVYTNRT
jgi:hypothetical protein